MRCTDCGQPVKPVVALDIDGTLADYHGHLIKFLIGYTGRVPDGRFFGSGSMREWAQEQFGIDRRTWEDAKLAFRQGAMKRTMPAFFGAQRLCQLVQESGAELWLTTTRPYLRLDNVDPDTRVWLERNGIPYDYLLYDEQKYAVLAERVDPMRVVAVLDDELEQVEAAARWFKDTPIWRLNGYNDDGAWRGAVGDSLPEIAGEITTRVADWRVQ